MCVSVYVCVHEEARGHLGCLPSRLVLLPFVCGGVFFNTSLLS